MITIKYLKPIYEGYRSTFYTLTKYVYSDNKKATSAMTETLFKPF